MGTAFKLRNGSLLLSTEAPGGIYNSSQLKKIAALSDEDAAIVKVTEDQRLALFVKPENADQIAKELKAIGLGIRDYLSGLHQPTACIGEMCPDHQQDALGAAMTTSEALASITIDSPLRIGINGCARCCVPCHTLDISVVGDEEGYKIYMGGKNSQIPEVAAFMAEGVPQAALPGLLKKIIQVYKDNKQEDESLQDVMDRIGVSQFVKVLHPYSQDAHHEEDAFETELKDSDHQAEDLGGDLEFDVDESKVDETIQTEEDPEFSEEGLNTSIDDDFTDAKPHDDEFMEDEIKNEPMIEGDFAEVSAEPEIVVDEDFELEASPEILDYQNRSMDKRLDELDRQVDEEEDDDDTFNDAIVEISEDEDSFNDAVVDVSEDIEATEAEISEEDFAEGAIEEEASAADLTDEDLVIQIEDNLETDDMVAGSGVSDAELEERVQDQLDEVSVIKRASSKNADARLDAERIVEGGQDNWDFTGFQVGDGGKILLSFSSGAIIEVNAENIKNGNRSFEVSGRLIKVSSSQDKVQVELDEDFKVMIPNKKTA